MCITMYAMHTVNECVLQCMSCMLLLNVYYNVCNIYCHRMYITMYVMHTVTECVSQFAENDIPASLKIVHTDYEKVIEKRAHIGKACCML